MCSMEYMPYINKVGEEGVIPTKLSAYKYNKGDIIAFSSVYQGDIYTYYVLIYELKRPEGDYMFVHGGNGTKRVAGVAVRYNVGRCELARIPSKTLCSCFSVLYIHDL